MHVGNDQIRKVGLRHNGIVQRVGVCRGETRKVGNDQIGQVRLRLPVGPALETGLTLHLLHGFPYLPGSAVRGLVRRAAESDLTAACEPWTARLAAGDLPPDAEISSFLHRAQTVRTLFGSL